MKDATTTGERVQCEVAGAPCEERWRGAAFVRLKMTSFGWMCGTTSYIVERETRAVINSRS